MNELINLTPMINVAITILAALALKYIIPWIKGKTTAQERENLLFWVDIAVKAAQQLLYQADGAVRLEYVMNYLRDKGFNVEDASVRNTVEAAVLELHQAMKEDADNE